MAGSYRCTCSTLGRVFGPVQQLGRPLQAEETAQDFEFPLKPVLNLSSLAMLQIIVINSVPIPAAEMYCTSD
jgi:hypothetical protein